jgi:hypothetical protein
MSEVEPWFKTKLGAAVADDGLTTKHTKGSNKFSLVVRHISVFVEHHTHFH